MPRQRVAFREVVGRSQVMWGVGLALCFITVATLIVIASRFEPEYVPDELVDRPVIARVNFNAVDVEGTKTARRDASRKTPGVYKLNSLYMDETRKTLTALPEVVAKADSLKDIAPKIVDRFGLTDEAMAVLKTYDVNGVVSPAWVTKVNAFVDQLKRIAILTSDDYSLEKVNPAPTIRLMLGDDQSMLVWEGDLYVVNDARDVTRAAMKLTGDFASPVRQIIVAYMIKAAQPTYTLQPQLTAKAQEQAAKEVKDVRVDYQAGQVLIPAGTRMKSENYQLLQQHIAAIPARQRAAMELGLAGLVAFISFVMIGYVVAFKRRIVEKPMRGLALIMLLLGGLGLAWWSGRSLPPQVTTNAPIVPMLFVAIIVSIAYDQRFALGIALFESLLMGVALNLSIGNYMITMLVAIVAVAQLRQLRHRSTLGRVGLLTGLVAAGGIWFVGLSERYMVDGLIHELARESMVGLAASVLTAFVILGVLPFIEKAFKVTTAMTLLELGDMNSALLKRLAQSAPGTFNHSLQVATLAEAAADSIGANGLLARVGAYYHDIGKINKPQYFVENQAGGPSRHEKLSPAMSLLIIVGHVKDGVEMAREYGLPPGMIHFIESHHGTTLVEYFYHAARKLKGEDQQPEEVEFRYPGPKPHTKEAAILMLCDCVESACRTMAEPTAVRIEQLVAKMTNKRLMDGQFDQCDITLAELKIIEQAVTKSLCAIYHGRISYPGDRERDRETDKQTAPATMPAPKERFVG